MYAVLSCLADIVLRDLSWEHSLEVLSSIAGLSARIARRLFSATLRLSSTEWRQEALPVRAIDLLAHGESISTVADDLSHTSPNNLIAMSRIAFGVTPERYVRADSHDAGSQRRGKLIPVAS